jgi:hypothetical protein
MGHPVTHLKLADCRRGRLLLIIVVFTLGGWAREDLLLLQP